MQIVPTSLVRISRYYMLTAVGYLLITLAIGVLRVLAPLPDDRIHWVPAILSWVSFPIMGAYYQFFPTLQGRDLRFEKLTLPQYALVNLGVLGMLAAAALGNAAAFALAMTVYAAGALLFVALILGNVGLSRLNLTLRFYLASLGYFAVAVVLLLLREWGLGPGWVTRPLLLHLFVFGWAILAIMGAEYSMVPMLQLKELRHPALADRQFYVAVAGVLGLAIGMATGDARFIAAAGALLLIAIGMFVYIIAASLIAGPSRLPKLDISVRYIVVGLAYLVATSLLGTLMGAAGWYALTPIHLHLGLIGMVSNTIFGAMYHIVPFVVWWEVYAPRLGTEQVPLLKQLYDERSAERQLYGLNAGLLLMLAGFAFGLRPLLAAGGALLLIVALAHLQQMLRVVGHRRRLRNGRPGNHETGMDRASPEQSEGMNGISARSRASR